MFTYVRNHEGFTLVELLVVIAIIGVLASITVAALDGSRKKGRDARRLSDIKQIQLALELYYDGNGHFPAGTSAQYFDPTALTSAGYIAVVPTDPLTNSHYLYVPYAASTNAGTCSGYHLGATLESSNHDELAQDADISGSLPIGFVLCTAGSPPSSDFNGLGTAANCSGSSGTPGDPGAASPIESCYDVRS